MKKHQKQDQFKVCDRNGQLVFAVNSEILLPENAPVRLTSAQLEGLDYRELYRAYSPKGRKSKVDPRVLFKVVAYGYQCGIWSSRKLEEACRYRVDFMWLLEEEPVPDHATLARFRKRCANVIEGLFYQYVQLLENQGETDHETVFIDGTKIESKANKYTFVWRKTTETNRAKLIEKIKILLSQIDECIAQENTEESESQSITPSELRTLANELNGTLEKESKPATKGDRKTKNEKKKRIKHLKEYADKLAEYDDKLGKLGDRNSYSKTDEDATFMRMKEDAMNNGQTKPGYNLQISAENQFITDFALFPNPTDTLTMIPFLNSFQKRYGHYPSVAVADAGYGSEENYRFMEESGIEAYVKYNRFHIEQRPRYTPNPFNSDSFYYNENEDYYVCPMGQHMERIGTKHSKTASGYCSENVRYRAQRCSGCPLRCLCYKSKGERRIIDINHRLKQYKRKVTERLISDEGVRHRGRRCVEPEAVFGQMKQNMQYKRFRHFGIDKVTMDFALFAMAFNLKKMCKITQKQGEKTKKMAEYVIFFLFFSFLLLENRIFDKILKKSLLIFLFNSQRVKKEGASKIEF